MLRYLFLIILSFSLGISSSFADVDPWKESHRMEKAYQYDTAINVLKGISADNELVKLRRGWLNYLKGSHSKAIEHYKLAIKANQNSLDARLGVILPLLAQQRWHEAAENARKVLEISPWNYYAHIRLMETEEALKKWQTLEKHADAVHQRYPSDATVLVYLARAHLKLDNRQAASKYYSKVLELIPDHFEAKQYAN
jgi:tetratricopeptide (TPR) repeat protein